MTSRELYERYASAVAYIAVKLPDGGQTIGSAFHVGEGVFLTARHVVEDNQILLDRDDRRKACRGSARQRYDPRSTGHLPIRRPHRREGLRGSFLSSGSRYRRRGDRDGRIRRAGYPSGVPLGRLGGRP
jgi:hypothetical protein